LKNSSSIWDRSCKNMSTYEKLSPPSPLVKYSPRAGS